MASKRKSTVPCMVRAADVREHEDQDEGELLVEMKNGSQLMCKQWTSNPDGVKNLCEVLEEKVSDSPHSQKPHGGYECKYCPFTCATLKEFTEHVDTQHPNVILNPLYVCAVCNFITKKYDMLADHNSKCHRGECNLKLKLIKSNNQTVLEQTIEEVDKAVLARTVNTATVEKNSSSLSGGVPNNVTDVKMEAAKTGTEILHQKGEKTVLKKQIEELANIVASVGNGREIVKDSLLQEGATHVMPSVQLPPNINLVPKVPVPLNTTKYNTALDTNAVLISSFIKFPYPTQAELSRLTVSSRHPEEQIRIWFATQRLKHGISWSPEEVEEARKKMFNGTIQQLPQTITVLPAQFTAATTVSQPLLQTTVPCQIIGQPGLVLTQIPKGPSVTCTPVTLAVGSSTGHAHKRPLQNSHSATEAKQLKLLNVSVKDPVPSSVAAGLLHERKKTKGQIAALKSSFMRSHFPADEEIYRLIEVTGLPRSDIKKWFSDNRYRTQRGVINITSESVAPLGANYSQSHNFYDISPHKFKGKNAEQLKILENSFLTNSFPPESEIDRLRVEAKLTRREIDSWFAERRQLKENTEQASFDITNVDSSDSEQKTPNGSIVEGGEISSSPLSSPLPFSIPSSSSIAIKKTDQQLHFLKSMFIRTQWPSPEEYDQLAEKTGLVRTEIVRWFKDNRLALKNGSLKWFEQYQKQNSDRLLDEAENKGPVETAVPFSTGATVLEEYYRQHKELREEDLEKLAEISRLNCEQIREWFTKQETKSRGDQDKKGNADADGDDFTVEDRDCEVDGADDNNNDYMSHYTNTMSQTVQGSPPQLAEYDSEGMVADISFI
ncbi:zinc fingers and homeoboxes protein 2 [Protopterus annectens]|uniref:zinc fingers and homeoboxes protein 2 n=1 Tax=Protopterus annectens TaxID=7888 RepID=UPI001CFADB37|nr:zinc fingers and homeoboxes protein 2 [Protopterus annectens]